MSTALRIRGEVTEDGRLVAELPAELPRGPVLITLEPQDEDGLELTEEDLLGLGLTAQDIAEAPEIGAWANEKDTLSGEELVEQMRSAPVRYKW